MAAVCLGKSFIFSSLSLSLAPRNVYLPSGICRVATKGHTTAILPSPYYAEPSNASPIVPRSPPRPPSGQARSQRGFLRNPRAIVGRTSGGGPLGTRGTRVRPGANGLTGGEEGAAIFP